MYEKGVSGGNELGKTLHIFVANLLHSCLGILSLGSVKKEEV